MNNKIHLGLKKRKSEPEIHSSRLSLSKEDKMKSISNRLSMSPKIMDKKNKHFINNGKSNNEGKYRKIVRKASMKSIKMKNNSFYNHFHMNNLELNNRISKRYSIELLKNKRNRYFHRIMPRVNSKTTNKNHNKYFSTKNFSPPIDKLENNIKLVLNNMKNEIEKKNEEFKVMETESFTEKNVNNRFRSNPDLKFVFSNKFNNFNNKKNTFLVQNNIILDLNFSFIKNNSIKRANSFDFSELARKKIIKTLKVKAKKNRRSSSKKYERNKMIQIYTYENENYSKSKGFAFHPNSAFVYIFDAIIIFANLYSFIFLPLRFAKNEDIRGSDTLFDVIVIYLIDIIFISDLIISMFRGYYNDEMEIIKNNKKILIHYLEQDFFMDLFEALPINVIIKLGEFKENNVYLGYSDTKLIFLKLLIFIKPFKTFKIFNRSKNKILGILYDHLSKNFFLENIVTFMSYVFIFFLFNHLFICLHIFFALQSFPNWITHINAVNENFMTKYITSFYFLMTTMTTVGYGDIVCISLIERIFHIILLAIGTILYTFLVSKISYYLRDQSHELIKLNRDLSILENIRISNPNMPFKLYYKIKNHLLNISKKRKKNGISLLISDIPETLKNNILFTVYSKEIDHFSMFKDVKNSSFVLQVLSCFIPIVSKKEEILILEGEYIENVIFVKDGRLVMEIVIDLNEPYKSIQKYLDINFNGISREEEEISNNEAINRVNTLLKLKDDNFNELKEKLCNIIIDKQKTVFNNNLSDFNNGISVDIGRMDFSKEHLDNSEDYEILKVFDVRKNEHFGDVHMFLQKPSPITLRTKTRIADLLLLRKTDAKMISQNYSNIWRNIYNKSYHNLVSIKQLTFRILKRYYNTHFYSNQQQFFHFDTNSKSFTSTMDGPSFLKNCNTKKFNKINKNIKIKKATTGTQNHKIPIKNELSVKPNFNKRKSSVKTLDNKIPLNSNDTLISNSLHNSMFKSQSSIIIKDKINPPKELEIFHNDNFVSEPNDSLTKKNNFDNFTFVNNNSQNKLDKLNILNDKISINKSKLSRNSNNDDKCNTSIEHYNEIIESINCSKRESGKHDAYINQTLKYFNKKNYSNGNVNIMTLEDIDKNFSKKIKKKIKRRKKIEKLKNSFKLQKKENNKNLLKLYSDIMAKKLNPILKTDTNDMSKNIQTNIVNELMGISLDSSNTKDFSQFLESSSEEYTGYKFNTSSLNITLTESFEIKSSYKNANELSKGDILNKSKYKSFIENILKIKSNIFNDPDFKPFILKISEKCKNYRKLGEDLMNFSPIKNKSNKDIFINIKSPKNNLIKQNQLLFNNLNEQLKKNKSISKLELDKFNKLKLSDLNKNKSEHQSENNDEKLTIDIDNTKSNIHKKAKRSKNIFSLKNIEIPAKSNMININGDKSFTSSKNIFRDLDKDDSSKINKIQLLNKKKNINSVFVNNIYNIENKREKNCIAF